MDQYVKVNIKESVRTRLKEQAADKGMTLADYIESLAAGYSKKPFVNISNTDDEGERLLEELDNKNEHPEDFLSDEDKAILEGLVPGELPACCQEIFDDPEHPVPTCKHWRKAYENYYGQRMWGYVNDLVGGGYRTWFSKYVK